jgi:putative oxidoreductase
MESERPPVFPSLVGPLSLLGEPVLALLRIAVGLSLFAHGWYIAGHMQETADWLAGEGYSNALASTWIIMLVQTVAALCLAAGLLTRLVALPILVFLLNAIVYHWPKGFFWNFNGFEYPLVLSIVVLMFLVRGGGRYALDRLLPRSF